MSARAVGVFGGLLIAALGAISSLGAQDCNTSEFELPGTYFPRELGVVRHFSGDLSIGSGMHIRSTYATKEYVGPRTVEGVLTECIRVLGAVTQFGEKHENEMLYYYLVSEDGICQFSSEIGGRYLPRNSEECGDAALRGPVVENSTWPSTGAVFLVLAGDEQVDGVKALTSVVSTGQVVEVEGGRFECCVVTRTVATTDEPHRVLGFGNAGPCSAYIEVSKERTYAPGMGIVLTERRERAFLVGYSDSVIETAVDRTELTGIERK